MTTSTMGTISYQKDDGEDEVTSGLGVLQKQPSFRIIKKLTPLLRPVSAPSDSVRKTSPKQKQALFEELNKFNEIKKESENDNTFARENNMDSIYWCWNCQHSECDQH